MSITLNDGNKAPWLAFGTGTALYGQNCAEAVRLAIENGITHIDGAQMYKNEEYMGAGIAASGKSRSELFVVTKLGRLGEGQSVQESLEQSLKKLGLEYVDLFLIHSPLQHEGRRVQVWKEMEEVCKRGLAKSIGVSNFKTEHLEEILSVAEIVPTVNQIEFHPYVLEAASPIVETCKKHNIVVASYAGLTPITQAKGGPLDSVVENVRQRLEETRGNAVSSGQVLLKWINQQGIIAVTTSSKAWRIREYLDAINIPELTADEMQAISGAGAVFHKRMYMRAVFGE